MGFAPAVSSARLILRSVVVHSLASSTVSVRKWITRVLPPAL